MTLPGAEVCLVLFLLSLVILPISKSFLLPHLPSTSLNISGRRPQPKISGGRSLPHAGFLCQATLSSVTASLHELHFSFPGRVAKLLVLAKITASHRNECSVFAQGTTSAELWYCRILHVSIFRLRTALGTFVITPCTCSIPKVASILSIAFFVNAHISSFCIHKIPICPGPYSLSWRRRAAYHRRNSCPRQSQPKWRRWSWSPSKMPSLCAAFVLLRRFI